MNNLIRLSFALIPIILTACDITSSIDYDIPQYPDKIVVTGLIGLKNKAEVNISVSHSPLSTVQDSFYVAEVSLFEDDIFVEKLIGDEESGYCSTPVFSTSIGGNYSLRVRMDGFPDSFSGIETIPSPVQIDSGRYILNTENEALVNIYFKDPPGNNYYSIKVIPSLNDTLVRDYFSGYKIFKESYVFDDKLFNMQSYSYESKVNLSAGRYNNRNLYYNKVEIILYSISEAGYKFFKSLDESESTNGDMFMEPAQIESNITNGYGVFAAYSTDTIKINLNK